MQEVRQFAGYVTGVAIVVAVAGFSFLGIATEGAGYLPDAADAKSNERLAGLSAAATDGANPIEAKADEVRAHPVWIAPTPKYQYDPKLMELKPPHQMKAEAQRRRQQEIAAHQARQREAQLRAARNREAARNAFASVRDASPPAFLMFSLQ